jgi:hypothetical protein
MQAQELLLNCCTDSALYGLRNATVMVRRLARNAEVQKEMVGLQNAIRSELERRKQEDTSED